MGIIIDSLCLLWACVYFGVGVQGNISSFDLNGKYVIPAIKCLLSRSIQ